MIRIGMNDLPISRVEHVFDFCLVNKLWKIRHNLLELFHAQELFVDIVQGSSDTVGVGLGAN